MGMGELELPLPVFNPPRALDCTVVPHVIAVVPPGRKYRTEAVVPLPQATEKKFCRAGCGSTARSPRGSTVAGRSTVSSRKSSFNQTREHRSTEPSSERPHQRANTLDTISTSSARRKRGKRQHRPKTRHKLSKERAVAGATYV